MTTIRSCRQTSVRDPALMLMQRPGEVKVQARSAAGWHPLRHQPAAAAAATAAAAAAVRTRAVAAAAVEAALVVPLVRRRWRFLSWHRCARGRSGWQTVRILLQHPYCNTTIVLQGFCAPSLKGRRVRRLILRFFIRPYQMGEFRLSFLPARLLLAASVVASCTGVCSRAKWNTFDTTERTHAGSSK